MNSMLALDTSYVSGSTFNLVKGDMHYHGPQGAFITERFLMKLTDL